MWTTIAVLALALNFEPTRLGIIALLVIRPHPIRQLIALLAGSFLTSAIVGLVVLLLIHHGVPTFDRFNGAKVQIAVGIAAVLAAILLASNISTRATTSSRSPRLALATTPFADEAQIQNRLVAWVIARADGLIRGGSPWFTAAIGVCIAIPSIDYLALLTIIATSGVELMVQITALLTFLTVANVVLLIPIASYLMAPDRTRGALERLRDWMLARRRRDFAILLAIAGGLMIALGVKGL